MNAWLPLRPRPAHELRNVQAARLAANTCSQLPLGFWQRRLAARAFGLSVVPPIDRHGPSRTVCWTLGGTHPVFVVQTDVAIWGMSADAQGDPVQTLQQLRCVGARPFTAVLTVVPFPCAQPLTGVDGAGIRPAARRGARLRTHVLPSEALQIGVLHWHDLEEVFEEAACAFAPMPMATLARQAAQTLENLARASGAAPRRRVVGRAAVGA